MLSTPKVSGLPAAYLSGSITGRYKADVLAEHAGFAGDLAKRVTVFSPMRSKTDVPDGLLATSFFENSLFASPRAIVARNVGDIRRCGTFACNLTHGDKVSVGSLLELGVAHALGRQIVVAITPGGAHDHPHVHALANTVTHSVEELAHVVGKRAPKATPDPDMAQRIYQQTPFVFAKGAPLVFDLRDQKTVNIHALVAIGQAYALHYPALVVMEEHGNPHDHSMLRQMAHVFSTHTEARRLLSPHH